MTEPVSGMKPVLALLMRLLWAAALALPTFGAQAGVVFASLYSFTGTNDGWSPNGLVQGSDGYFYGTTYHGGTNGYANYGSGYGTVFKITTNGALTTLYSFGSVQDTNGYPLDGANPQAALVQGSDGNFYGTTAGWNGLGGPHYPGTVFKISTNGALTSLYSFTGTNDGAGPNGLVPGSDGNFYGTTDHGGTNGNGTVFKITTNGALTSLYSFGSVQDNNGDLLDGANPQAGLVQGSDGNFYGTTYHGGTNGNGTVFRITTNGTLTSLYSFTGYNDGGTPDAALVQGSDGYFYGTTEEGGTTNYNANFRNYGGGTVFKISPNGTLTSLYSFTNSPDGPWPPHPDGAYPEAGLVQGSDGNFYGTTAYGGMTGIHDGYGTVFQITTNGALTSLYSFGGVPLEGPAPGLPGDGAYPEAGLVQGSDGNFYGTTSGGGQCLYGTVFRLTILPPPQLQVTILPFGPYVKLTWPTNYIGFTLQSTTNLVSPAVWSTNSPPPLVFDGQNVVFNAISGPQMFFRLSQ